MAPADARKIRAREQRTAAEIATLRPGMASPLWRSSGKCWWLVREQNGDVTRLGVAVNGVETTLDLTTVFERYDPPRGDGALVGSRSEAGLSVRKKGRASQPARP